MLNLVDVSQEIFLHQIATLHLFFCFLQKYNLQFFADEAWHEDRTFPQSFLFLFPFFFLHVV